MFIEICKIIYEIYSKSFFKNWFYENLINLADDEIANVRISFLSMLVKLKKLWTIYDRDKLDVIEKTINKLLHDKDRDVVNLAEKVYIFF